MRIDLWADVVCPWCWIGETRLYRALDRRPEIEAEVSWRPFQLQPRMPAEGMPWDEFVERKFGGPQRARPMFAHVAAASAPDGLAFRFDAIPTAPNTRDPHRLILLAERAGAGRAMAEALFAGHFSRGRDLTDPEVLADLAAQAGLDSERVSAFIAGDELGREVDESQAEAASLGIQGVPFFVIDGRYAFSGAQPLETFLAVLDRVHGMDAAAD